MNPKLRATFAVFAALLMVLSSALVVTGSLLEAGEGSTSPAAAPEAAASGYIAPVGTNPTPDAKAIIAQTLGGPGQPSYCSLSFGVFTLGMAALACALYDEGVTHTVGVNEPDTAKDIMIALSNYLNETASEQANTNASYQELLSYYAARAEAIVPDFLGQTWNTTTEDEIISYSGLTSALAGQELSIADQEYYNWNATVWSYQNAFGAGQEYGGVSYDGSTVTNLVASNPAFGNDGGSYFIEGDEDGDQFNVTLPWEVWSGFPLEGVDTSKDYGAPTIYFTLATGGKVVDANIYNYSSPSYASWNVTDITTGVTWEVPDLSFDAFASDSLNNLTNVPSSVGPLDLLKAVCSANCTQDAGYLETAGGYAYEDAAPTGGYIPAWEEWDNTQLNTMVPELYISDSLYFGAGHVKAGEALTPVPDGDLGVCIEFGNQISGTNDCVTPYVPTEGDATQLGSGPAAAVGGNDTLSQFAQTAQNLVNNTELEVEAYFDVLSAATDDGNYTIPATCEIPTPSDALPTSADPRFYGLSEDNVLAIYLAYLDANAKVYNGVFSSSTDLCGDPNLGFSFNWTQNWTLRVNITASIYLGSTEGPIGVNGTADPLEVYSDPSTWDFRDIVPTILYPSEYYLDVDVGAIQPIPSNDPTAAMLVDWAGNEYYGNTSWSPDWGIPTYLSLTGYGNQVYPNGTPSSYGGGSSLEDGDAIEITSCVVNGNETSPCDLAATYFDVFTVGIQHAFIYPSCAAVGDCPGQNNLPNDTTTAREVCGTGSMNQWYDAWAGDIVTGVASVFIYVGNAVSGVPYFGGPMAAFFYDIGCLFGYIVLVVVLILLGLLGLYILKGVRGGRGWTRYD